VVAERVYRRRRAVVGGVSAIVAALSIVAVADVIGGAGAAGASSEAVVSGGVVVAQPGDTLWSIAGEHRGDVAIARYVDALVQLNGGPAIRAGQAVRLP